MKRGYRVHRGHAFIPLDLRQAMGWADREEVVYDIVDGNAVLIRRVADQCIVCRQPVPTGAGSTMTRGSRTVRICDPCRAALSHDIAAATPDARGARP